MSYSFSRPTKENFTCKLGSDIISYTVVNVDHKPGKVSKLSCNTVDLKEMECSFRQMSNNIPISYQLDYKLSTQLKLVSKHIFKD